MFERTMIYGVKGNAYILSCLSSNVLVIIVLFNVIFTCCVALCLFHCLVLC